jgi:predicted GNAT family acetyltransferase
MRIVYARMRHLGALALKERMIAYDRLADKIRHKEVILAMDGETIIGWLRYGRIHDNVPAITMVHPSGNVKEDGIATRLVRRFEAVMRKKGHILVLASCPEGSKTRHLYRALGYEDAGGITLEPGSRERLFKKALL